MIRNLKFRKLLFCPLNYGTKLEHPAGLEPAYKTLEESGLSPFEPRVQNGGAGEIRTHVFSIKSRLQLPLCDDPVVYPICLRIFALQFLFNPGGPSQNRTEF